MYIKARKDLFSKESDGGIVVLNKDETEIFKLNKTASIIWKLCSTGSNVAIEDIVSGIQGEFIVEKDDIEQCKKDCLFIAKKNPELFEIVG
jgi:hypothetical protein